MSFNGACNIKLNGGSPTADSCAASQVHVNLIQFNGRDPAQQWIFRPIGAEEPDFYTIQSQTDGLYVIPKDDILTYGTTPYGWKISATGLVTTTTPTTLNWCPSDNGQFVIISANSSWTWTISPAS